MMNHTINNYPVFLESDWKLFRKKVIIWQENYMNQLNTKYISILTQDKKPSEKFWELDKNIYIDRRKPGVVLDMRRSMMLENIVDLLIDEVIQIEDLNDFSDTFKETFKAWWRYKK